jgi:hypothetical protein
MRSICKKGSVMFMTVLTLCAVASASASAAQWYVGGKTLTGSEKLAATVKVEEPIVLYVSDPNVPDIKITCTTASVPSSEIVAPSTAKIGSLELSGCSMSGAPGCSLGGTELRTEPIETTLSTSGPPPLTEDLSTFSQTKSEAYLIDLEITGSSCSVSGAGAKIYGQFTTKITSGNTEQTEMHFVGEGEASSGLEIIGWGNPHPPVYISGKFNLKLASGAKFSFRA